MADAVIDQIFELLPLEDASVLRRRFISDESATDIAQELGISRASVDQRVTRARSRLRAALAARPDLIEELRAGHPHIYPQGRR